MQAIRVNETIEARTRIPFRAIDNTDGVTELTGLGWAEASDVVVAKNSGAEAFGVGTINEIGHGNYYYIPDVSEINTLGFLLVRVENTAEGTMRAFVAAVQIVAYNPYNGESLGLTNLDATVGSRATQTSVDVLPQTKIGYKLASDGLDVVAAPADVTSDANARSSFIKMIRALFNRFYDEVTQTATGQKVRNDSGTVISTMSVSDDGTTQTKGKSV